MTDQLRLKSFNLGKFVIEYLVFIAIVLLVIITAIVEPRFLSAENFTNLMRQFGPLSFVALGMTFIIVGGFIDLSVPGMISLVAIISLSLVDTIGEIPAILVGLALGAAMGCLNGTILIISGASTQAKALFITFGMSQVYGALALIHTDGTSMNRNLLEHEMPLTRVLGSGMLGPLSVSFVVFLFFLTVLYIFQTRTFLGRSINYTGGNIVAAELSGIPTKRIMILIYAICGFMAAVSAVVLFSRVSVTTPTVGMNYERDAIMAVVVGGTSLLGGRGNVLRTVLGVSLVVLMSNCMNLMGVQSHLQEVVRGAILVIAIWLDHRRQ
ncbi:MAG: ABC transporter permease [Oscillospiraceae bacterium]|nr:ABC transporter permease [Oscillospiraceae bacterium]